METVGYHNSKKILGTTHTLLFPLNNYLFCTSGESSSMPGAGSVLVDKQKRSLFSWSLPLMRYFTFYNKSFTNSYIEDKALNIRIFQANIS